MATATKMAGSQTGRSRPRTGAGKVAPRPAGEPDKTTYRGRFAARLRELREAAGLSVETVAEAVGVSAKGYYHWEKGIRSPGFDDLPKLAKAVKAKSVAELFPNK